MRHHEDDEELDQILQNAKDVTPNPELIDQIEKLQEALKASELNTPASLTQGAVLQVESLEELSKRYLTASAQHDMSKKSNRLSLKFDDGRVFQAVYFSAVVKTGNEEKGVQAIARVINDLSSQGLIHSALAPMSALQLARMSSVAKSVVFAFPMIPQEYVKDCEAKYKGLFTLEGGVGNDIEDTSVPLAEGEFLAEILVTHNLAVAAENPKELVQRQIDQYLNFLPQGTEVRQLTQLAVYDLCQRTEVKFYNRLMQRVKRVELDYVREIAVFKPDHPEFRKYEVEQFNIITGIRYFDEQNKELYR